MKAHMIPAQCSAIKDNGCRCRAFKDLVFVRFYQSDLIIPSWVVAGFCPKHFRPTRKGVR